MLDHLGRCIGFATDLGDGGSTPESKREEFANARMFAASKAMLDALEASHDALKLVQWSGCDGSTRMFCPECQEYADGRRHADDCDLGLTITRIAAAIAAARQEGEGKR